MRHISIAIDGPAGAGKSTVAKQLANRLGILYVDTGAMYRGVAWLSVQSGVAAEDESGIVALLANEPLQFARNDDGALDILVNGKSIMSELRSPNVSEVVSQLSVHPQVRRILTRWQREVSEHQSVVMDGRDVGTVVLPNAEVKIFLTADLAERARRRASEFQTRGFQVSVEQLTTAIAERDERDSSRQAAPLKPADDAVHVDSTGKSVSEVVEEIMTIVNRVQHG